MVATRSAGPHHAIAQSRTQLLRISGLSVIEGGVARLITIPATISRYVTSGEWEDVASTLPKDVVAPMLRAGS